MRWTAVRWAVTRWVAAGASARRRMASGSLRLLLGDQLSRGLSALSDLDPDRDRVLLAEVWDEATYVRHHKKKIAFVFSAMRHFAAALRDEGVAVDYVTLDDPENSGNLRGEVARALRRRAAKRVVVTAPGEWRLWQDLQGWEAALGLPVEIRADERFFCTPADFAAWAKGRKALRMEYFYRELRRRTGYLMDAGGAPEGGRWNFDQDNRKALPRAVAPPPLPQVAPDATTRAVLELVDARFAAHFGDLEPFGFAVTAAQAERAFEDFVTRRAVQLRRLSGRHGARRGDAVPFGDRALPQRRAARPPGRSARGPRRPGATAPRRSTRWRASSARSWAGASSCAASTGWRCRTTRGATSSTPGAACRASTGPARRR